MKTSNINKSGIGYRKSQEDSHINKHNNFSKLYEYLETFDSNIQDPLISIVLPVYNEEKTIREVLESLPRNHAIEIIVVDDYSRDSSFDEIKKVENYDKIKLIRHKENRGYGGALLTGIKAARGQVLITMDSDGQHSSDDLFNLIKPVLDGKADISVGSRYKGSFNYKLPLSTRVGEAMLEIVITLFFGQRIKNNQCGFRAFHKRTYKIFDNIKFHGYAFTTELILLALLYNFRIREYPIHLLKRKHGNSYIILIKLSISLILCLMFYFFKNVKKILSRK
ncbi:MAG: glycosyltransferase family 2 protein [Candidatus Hodarchaeota archaeon]